jgi:glutaredoxin 3
MMVMPSQQAKVTVYTTKICPYCFRAKSILAKRGIAFDEVDVSNDTDKRMWLVKATGQKTVPQIFIDDVSIGGSDELAHLDREGELVKRAFGAAVP